MKPVTPGNWRPQGILDFEDRAWEALHETRESVCVTAGAGAGKTEFLAQKAAYLLQTAICPSPRRILAISFKRDAARNLSERLRRRCPDHGHRFVSLTFDAFAKSLLDQFRAAVPDGFRPSPDYRIVVAKRDEFVDYLKRHGRGNLKPKIFEDAVAETQLPLENSRWNEDARKLLQSYWDEQLTGGERSLLTFAMINRLAERLIRDNDQIKRALQTTYPVVFLDEFQDTTIAQYQVFTAAFGNSRSVVTAVGDDKQKIMGWAGAMENSFHQFTSDFKALPVSLVSNWRAHADLVAVQQLIASRIEPTMEPVVARGRRITDGSIAAIWQFGTREDEVNGIAQWIASQVGIGEVEPHRVSVLVRNHADRVEEEVAPIFATRGLSVRNVARIVGGEGGVAIQDLLSEELTEILMPFLRLAAHRPNPDAWDLASTKMALMHEVESDDGPGGQKVTLRLEELIRSTRLYLFENPPGDALAAGVTDMLIDRIGEKLIRQTTPAYERSHDFERVRAAFAALLTEALSGGGSWSEVLDRFDGVGQVPLMTVHKSKGLEFHTILFFGLDDKSWWSLKPANAEELKSFFVALTRAEQRAFFTCCSERGGPIAWLEEILGDMVPRVALS
jgi:superfamily I DNA/RNA helicase